MKKLLDSIPGWLIVILAIALFIVGALGLRILLEFIAGGIWGLLK